MKDVMVAREINLNNEDIWNRIGILLEIIMGTKLYDSVRCQDMQGF